MNERALVKQVAMREIVTRSRTKAFRIITAVLLALAVVGPIAAALWPESDDEARDVTIGLVASVDSELEELIAAIGEDIVKIEFVDTSEFSLDEIDTGLTSGDLDVVIESADRLAWKRTVDDQLATVIGLALQQQAAFELAGSLGLSEAETADLLAPIDITQRRVDAGGVDDGIRQAVAWLGLMLAFMLPQFFGQLTMLSVIEEKGSRVIEVLLSHVRPQTLLLGKVAGLSVLALGQVVVLLGGLTAALLVTDRVTIPREVWQFVPILTVSLIGGLVFYNTLFALLGSLVSRQEDASQVALPVFFPMMAGLFIGQFAAVGDSDVFAAKVLTFFPLTTPMLLPVRVARGYAAAWEVAVALALLLLGTWLLVRLAARLYNFTLLQAGSRVSWKQAATYMRK